MKKNLFLLAVLALGLASCKKQRGQETYEERLEGNWDLVSVQYQGTLPDPSNPGRLLNFDGTGTNVEGGLELRRNPYEVDYAFRFTANISVSDTTPSFPVPINESGSGTWTYTADESRIIITEEDKAYTFEVLTNEPTRQVLRTNISQTVFQFLTVNTDVELEFVKRQ